VPYHIRRYDYMLEPMYLSTDTCHNSAIEAAPMIPLVRRTACILMDVDLHQSDARFTTSYHAQSLEEPDHTLHLQQRGDHRAELAPSPSEFGAVPRYFAVAYALEGQQLRLH